MVKIFKYRGFCYIICLYIRILYDKQNVPIYLSRCPQAEEQKEKLFLGKYYVYVYTFLSGGRRTFVNKISDAKLYALARSATVR